MVWKSFTFWLLSWNDSFDAKNEMNVDSTLTTYQLSVLFHQTILVARGIDTLFVLFGGLEKGRLVR
jgi:hypothetical protein